MQTDCDDLGAYEGVSYHVANNENMAYLHADLAVFLKHSFAISTERAHGGLDTVIMLLEGNKSLPRVNYFPNGNNRLGSYLAVHLPPSSFPTFLSDSLTRYTRPNEETTAQVYYRKSMSSRVQRMRVRTDFVTNAGGRDDWAYGMR